LYVFILCAGLYAEAMLIYLFRYLFLVYNVLSSLGLKY